MIQDKPDLTTLASAMDAYDDAWGEFASALANPGFDAKRISQAKERILAIRKCMRIWTIEEE